MGEGKNSSRWYLDWRKHPASLVDGSGLRGRAGNVSGERGEMGEATETGAGAGVGAQRLGGNIEAPDMPTKDMPGMAAKYEGIAPPMLAVGRSCTAW